MKESTEINDWSRRTNVVIRESAPHTIDGPPIPPPERERQKECHRGVLLCDEGVEFCRGLASEASPVAFKGKMAPRPGISWVSLLSVGVILSGCDGFSPHSLYPSLRPKASNDLASRCPSLEGSARLPAALQRQMAIMENSYSHVSMPHVSMQLDFMDSLGKMGLGFKGPKVRAEEDVKTFSFSKVAVRPSLQGTASEATEAGRSDGKPKENQDKTVILKDIFDGISMYSVFDGHGSYGGQVAEWLTQQVPSDIKNALYRCGSLACIHPYPLVRGPANPLPSRLAPAFRTRSALCGAARTIWHAIPRSPSSCL